MRGGSGLWQKKGGTFFFEEGKKKKKEEEKSWKIRGGERGAAG